MLCLQQINHKWQAIFGFNLDSPLKILFLFTDNNLSPKICYETFVGIVFLLC